MTTTQDRINRNKKRRRKRVLIQRIIVATVLVALIAGVVAGVVNIVSCVSSHSNTVEEMGMDTQTTGDTQSEADTTLEEDTQETEAVSATVTPDADGMVTVGDTKLLYGYTATQTDATRWPSEDDVTSEYVILINEATNEIVAAKSAKERMNPASMTKILTVLVAAEHVTNLDDTVVISQEATDYSYINDCSAVGFMPGEVVSVRDLFYGTALKSGGDAAYALACYVAGSHEAFVDMMNEKLVELGLSKTTHFTNCVGVYDENHYSTAYDMAMILKAAVQNDWAREVLSLHKYTTTVTQEHPEGIFISNLFLRRIEDQETKGEVICAKTGYTDVSLYCAASFYVSNEGTPYICVTAKTHNKWRPIYDHTALYSSYLPHDL